MATAPATTSYDSFLRAARACIWNRGETPAWYSHEAIAQRAYDEQSCIWHAANAQVREHLDEAGYVPCRFCEGPTAPGQDGAHALCAVRHAKGRPTPRLDSTPACPCVPCTTGRPDERFAH